MEPDMTSTLIVPDRKLLVVHNVKDCLRVEASGGKRKPGETLAQCRDREVFEELGILVRAYSTLGDYETQTPEGPFLVRMELAEITSGVPRIQEKERHKLRGPYWRTYEELMGTWRPALVPNLREAISDLRKMGYL